MVKWLANPLPAGVPEIGYRGMMIFRTWLPTWAGQIAIHYS
jgi:hypothetical protein